MNLITISAGTPGQVESFRYQDGGMEKNVQDEFDARGDHLLVSRVVNWEVANEADYGLTGWTPTDSLLIYVSSNNLFVTKGLAYLGGRFLEGGSELFSSDDPATDTYYVYLKYTFASDTFDYEYATSVPADTDLVKYLTLGTADWNTGTKFWSNAVDLRSSNTSLGAPATVSGSDAGAIFTVENTGAGLGLLVKTSGAQIGQAADPQNLTIYGATGLGLTLYETTNSWSVILGVDAATRLKVGGDLNITGAIVVGNDINGVTLSGGDVTADALNLRDSSDQIVLDSDGTTGTLGTTGVLGGARTWDLPDASGTVAVVGDGGAMTVSSGGAVTHSTATGYKHVPTAGATTQVLQWSANGTAKWVTLSGGATIADGGVVTVVGTQHSHTTSEISNLNAGSDFNAGTLPIVRGGTNQTSFTSNALAYYSGSSLASIAAQSGSTYVLVGGSPPVWTNSPSIVGLTTSGGISVASVSATGNVVSSGGYVEGNYLRLDTAPSNANNTVAVGLGTGGQAIVLMDESGETISFNPTAARTSISVSGTGTSFSQNLRALGIQLGSTTDILPEQSGNSDCGQSGAYWANVFSYNLYYHPSGTLGTFDHLDDLAIIDSIVPTEKKNSEGVPLADLSGVPREIIREDGFTKTGSMQMLLVGGVKQLHKKVRDQDELITALMDQVKELKESIGNAG